MTHRALVGLALGLLLVPTGAAARQTAQATPKPATGRQAAAKPPKVALPAAVEAAFKAAYPNATINNVAKEKEGGQEIYEVESVDRGLHRDLNYKADGTVIDIEEEVAEADFPAAVATAIKARYPKATITKREKLTKDNTVSYEVQLKGAGVGEVVLTPDGKWISPKASK